MGRTTVVIDAANDPRLARDLTAGGAFVIGYDLAISEECDLVVHNGGVQMRLAARVVWINPVAATHGVGLEVVGFGAALRDQLACVIEGTNPAPLHLDDDALTHPIEKAPDLALGSETGVRIAPQSLEAARRRVKAASVMRSPAGSHPDLTPDQLGLADGSETGGPQHLGRVRLRKSTPPSISSPAIAPLEDDLAIPQERRVPSASTPPLGMDGTVTEIADVAEDAPDAPDVLGAADRPDPAHASIHARLRGLNLAEQIKLAHGGDLNERIVLERLYGKNVWEPLLRNPRLTAPEVARIAKMGALPRVLIEIIVANGGWLAIPDVRRALLGNPRLGTDQIIKILRLMPKPELRLVPTQMQLPMAVRECAKKLLRGDL